MKVLPLLLSLLLAATTAFAPRTFQAARVVPGTKHQHTNPFGLLHMSDPEKKEESTEVAEKAAAPASGTFYDDEVSRFLLSDPHPSPIMCALSQTILPCF